MLWEVARFNLVARCGVLLPRNLIKTCMCVCVCVCVCLLFLGGRGRNDILLRAR